MICKVCGKEEQLSAVNRVLQDSSVAHLIEFDTCLDCKWTEIARKGIANHMDNLKRYLTLKGQAIDDKQTR